MYLYCNMNQNFKDMKNTVKKTQSVENQGINTGKRTGTITKAIFHGAEWCKCEEALIEAKRISKNFTVKNAQIPGSLSSYSFRYDNDTINVFYNPK